MPTVSLKETYTPSQVAAVTGLPLPAVQKAIEHRLIHPKRMRAGGAVQRLLSRSQVLYLVLEARGLRSLPLNTRRQIAKAVEQDPGVDMMAISKESVVFIEFKAARKALDRELRRLTEAEGMVTSDSQVMHGTPVYKGTRIPVHSIADMLSQGASTGEILEGYPALTREQIELAPMYAKAFPKRGRPSSSSWAKQQPNRVTKHRLAS